MLAPMGEIWYSGVPIFTPISATCHLVGRKTSKSPSGEALCTAYNAASNQSYEVTGWPN